jgi:predicted membrane protein DUF2306
MNISIKYYLFLACGCMTLFVFYHTDRFLLVHRMKDWGYYFSVRWWIVVHASAGAMALVLGPLQFSSTLRRRRPAAHRLIGRLYLGGIAVAAPIAVFLGFTHAIPSMALPTLVQSILWVVTGSAALLAARNRNFELHRQWVIRSYAITFIFIVTRVLMAIPALARQGFAALVPLLWILNIAALLIAQLGMNWLALFARHRQPSS